MPAPSGLKSLIEAQVDPRMLKSQHFTKLTGAFATEIEMKWTKWILSMMWGENQVSGIGIGVWSGSGTGGKLSASPFGVSASSIFAATGFLKKTPATDKLLSTFEKIVNEKFDAWVKDFKMLTVNYVGVCSALPPAPPVLPIGAPGPFSATSITVPLIALGQSKAPSGISDAWDSKLKAGPDPKFNLDNPLVMTKLLTKAIGSTIELQFTSVFLTTSMASGDTVSGTGAPGTGAGSAKSSKTGKII
jgi:hypothetical protein